MAEVLITLGIIGVVAAITIPTLMTKYQNLVLSTQLKKVVNNMDNNTKAFLAKEGLDDLLESSLFIRERGGAGILNINLFVSHFKFELLHNSKLEKDLRNSGVLSGHHGTGKFYYSPDGSFWYILSKYVSGDGFYGEQIFDINGDKGPNKWGYDRFLFALPMTASDFSYYKKCDTLITCVVKNDLEQVTHDGLDISEFKEVIKNYEGDDKEMIWALYGLMVRMSDGWNIEW